jgi:hypothetical protein
MQEYEHILFAVMLLTPKLFPNLREGTGPKLIMIKIFMSYKIAPTGQTRTHF